jgi:3-oxoacyl-[acyl-carrier protein] reductase
VKQGITVNVIAPALIKTEMITGNRQVHPEFISIECFGTVEEVALVALMLARNGYITRLSMLTGVGR